MAPSAVATAYIRHATEADVPTILSLINDLARYEKALDEVKATEQSLRSSLSFLIPTSASSSQLSSATTLKATATQKFTSGHARTLLISAPDGAVAGMALYFFNYSTWRSTAGVYLEDLFVRPEYRRRGYGKLLFGALARVVRDVSPTGGRLDWSVLKWNEPSIAFYNGLGAVMMNEWATMRVEGHKLDALAEVGTD
ncbi:MAG: hypothetical protein M1814_002723 [Vezdaea aestivalis]|nr:MAG: hypothetical protein M1814_002723 [Vezdaea aestivalis]